MNIITDDSEIHILNKNKRRALCQLQDRNCYLYCDFCIWLFKMHLTK